jgi:hypothetical protein
MSSTLARGSAPRSPLALASRWVVRIRDSGSAPPTAAAPRSPAGSRRPDKTLKVWAAIAAAQSMILGEAMGDLIEVSDLARSSRAVFARPLVDADPGRIDERRLCTLLGFAINVWNLVVTEEIRDSGNNVAELRAELAPDRIPAEVLAWFDRLVVRKRERFHGDLRLVGNWRVRRDQDRLDIEMESRVPEALHTKLTAAGLLS